MLKRLAAGLVLASVALGTVASTTFAATGATTETFRVTHHEVEDHGYEQYIFDVVGIAHMTTRPGGVLSTTYNQRQVQTHVVNGVVVDVITSTSASHGILLDEENFVLSHTTQHDRYHGPDGQCQTTIGWQYANGQLIFQHFKSVCP
jgi:hypothetical protein